MTKRHRLLFVIALCMLPLAAACGGGESGTSTSAAVSEPIVIFAAASTGEALKAIASELEPHLGRSIQLNAAGTSTLAAQIRAGGPADIFLSADQRWMDELAKDGLIDTSSRRNLLANELVLIAPAGGTGTASIAMEKGNIPAELAKATRIAIADPEHVPAGRYANEAFAWLGWKDALAPHYVAAQDVRAALRLVELGEAEFGVVYASDAKTSTAVRLVATFPAESHTPIVYPIALTASAKEGSRELLAELAGDAASRHFRAAGFQVISP